jgi:large subunit ribosomal protein L23
VTESRRVIKRPLVTEKSVTNTALSQYCFEVATDATKRSIKTAVEEIFKVTVLRVNTVTMPRSVARSYRKPVRRRIAVRGSWKKAVVTVKAGDKIQLGGVNYFES